MTVTPSPRRSSRLSKTSTSPLHGPSSPRSRSRRSSPPGNKLRPVSPEELAEWQEGDQDSDATLSEPQPSELDEPWPFTFRPGESVWIRTAGGNWYPGKVSGQTTRKGQTREV
ncbi:hypothetical protein PTI98_002176 [Pleurotus ostreatus]|nr:hypothetical protein PTI98_002176 [Pleurotus ostreatus]